MAMDGYRHGSLYANDQRLEAPNAPRIKIPFHHVILIFNTLIVLTHGRIKAHGKVRNNL